MTISSIDRDVIDAIEAVITTRQPERTGSETRFLCPVHDDHHPSGRWNPQKHIWVCDACGAGGGYRDLAERLGITLPAVAGLTVAELAVAKGLSENFLRDLGVADGVSGAHRTSCVDVPYADLSGEIVAVRKRLRLTGDNRFLWRKGDHPIPYGLAMLRQAREETNFALIVEGESDQWVCRRADVPAIGIPGASLMKREWGDYFQGIANVFVWQEPGTGGLIFAQKVADAVPTVRVIIAPVDAKDPAEFWLRCRRDADEFRARMSELAFSAPYASAIKADASRHEAHELLAVASPLLDDPDLLDRIEEAIRSLGYAGDATPALITYLGLASRLSERPLNLALVGPSSAGKNRAVDSALALMPSSAYHLERAGSARALVYGEESYQHRIVVVAEADSIPEEGPAASAVRSLAADNEMTYDTVEKDASGKFVVRHIVKPGPTGLITTSTRPLPHQFDTRTLTVTVKDTPDQTREVMRAHAARLNGVGTPPDVSDLIAVQRWLELEGERRVRIPYAARLAELVPADHVRMRRDFRQLLTMIEAVAMMHQRQRERDSDGRIIASVDDYARARTLLFDVFQTAVSAGLTPQVRETVLVVQRIYDGNPLRQQTIAKALGLSKEAGWYRIRRAISLGYLANDETRKGQPAKIRPGEPLPEDCVALPAVQDLTLPGTTPETPLTVQPLASLEASDEYESLVERTVVKPLQPQLQPPSPEASDSGSLRAGVGWLNG